VLHALRNDVEPERAAQRNDRLDDGPRVKYTFGKLQAQFSGRGAGPGENGGNMLGEGRIAKLVHTDVHAKLQPRKHRIPAPAYQHFRAHQMPLAAELRLAEQYELLHRRFVAHGALELRLGGGGGLHARIEKAYGIAPLGLRPVHSEFRLLQHGFDIRRQAVGHRHTDA
jgi:hypothetical protein